MTTTGPTEPLSPTARTRLRRHADRGRRDRAELLALLEDTLVCHLGVVTTDGPLVLPTAFGVDADGPDDGGTIYVHGSVAASCLEASVTQDLCITVTVVDGLVLARSGFHHSMNYRSAVVRGRGRQVVDAGEKERALRLVVDHVVPARMATLRPHSRREIAATRVVAVPLREASLKQRTGDPVDDVADVDAGGWAGVVPLSVVAADVQTAADAAGVTVPEHVRRRQRLAGS